MSASDDSPEEAPEYQSTPMTPVSPKPIHVPAPSNVPILELSENQMDQAYQNDLSRPNPSADAAPPVASSLADDTAGRNDSASGQAPVSTMAAATAPDTLIEAALSPVRAQDPSQPLEAATDQTQLLESKIAPAEQTRNVPDTGGVDIQAILDNLAASVTLPNESRGSLPTPHTLANDETASADTLSAFPSNVHSTPTSFPAVLPPRPSAQGYPFAQALPSAEPSPSSEVPNTGPPGASYQAPLNPPPTLTVQAAPGTEQTTGSLPPPPSATFQQSPTAANSANGTAPTGKGDDGRNQDENLPWGPEIQKLYDEFLKDERRYVLEGRWDSFPLGSRLFIGNLPSERVTKRDLFHVFHKHGKLAQISIKQAYGFIQFLEKEACQKAHFFEQNVPIRGKKVNLEISKPQRNTKGGGNNSNNSGRGRNNRRSRSPSSTLPKGADRYVGTGARRDRDRSPSSNLSPPPRRRRSPDNRRRSRSRSPRRTYSPHQGHSRTTSDDDASLPLPHRAPQDVPEVQIIAKDSPDQAFIQYIDGTFKSRGVRSDILLLSPRLNETAVVRRQIIEGVLAVMKIDRANMATQKFGLSIFDRSAGSANVRFEEYGDLDLNVCVELVLRARQTARPPQAPALNQYGLPMVPPSSTVQPGLSQYGNGFPHSMSSLQASTPFSPLSNYSGGTQGFDASGNRASDPSNPLAGMNPNALQQLLGNLQRATPQPASQNHGPPTTQMPLHDSQGGQQPAGGGSADIMALLSQLGKQPQAQGQQPQAQQNQSLPPSLAALLGQTSSTANQGQGQAQAGGQQQQQQPDMNAIMAQLSRYNGR
ncbi:hypothetical protein FH972_026199 [Carpinus fangiana]|uniref:RRM domain-containing protein n=1 Tax=Carpinus fangiana TaxID=176857 RepID=A0A5N6L3B8_9ROSI|nr:hypothetical protein FH972_026199 [Carpinus fangiana]